METSNEVAQRLAPKLENIPTSEPSKPLDSCRECAGSGWRMVGSMAMICGCAIQSKIKIALPERYQDARLDDFSAAVRDPVTAWLDRPTDGLFVAGNCGTGKTHLGAAITRHLISKSIPVKFLRCADLFRGIREMFKSDSPYAESELMTPLEKCRVLILDDLG